MSGVDVQRALICGARVELESREHEAVTKCDSACVGFNQKQDGLHMVQRLRGVDAKRQSASCGPRLLRLRVAAGVLFSASRASSQHALDLTQARAARSDAVEWHASLIPCPCSRTAHRTRPATIEHGGGMDRCHGVVRAGMVQRSGRTKTSATTR